jgi:AraC family transcriptional regulator
MVVQLERSNKRLPRGAAALLSSEIFVEESDKPAVSQGLSCEQRARLGSVVRLLETADRNLPHYDNEAHRCVAKATALLQAECEFASAISPSAKRRDFIPAWKMTRIMAFIDANLDRPIRIEEMAAIARLSCSHFSRAFRSTMGEPPSAFVIQRRVERAERLILLTNRPLSQIALDCGMADQSHLTKLFHRSYGMSPGRWRKLQHGSETVANTHQLETPGLAFQVRDHGHSSRSGILPGRIASDRSISNPRCVR